MATVKKRKGKGKELKGRKKKIQDQNNSAANQYLIMLKILAQHLPKSKFITFVLVVICLSFNWVRIAIAIMSYMIFVHVPLMLMWTIAYKFMGGKRSVIVSDGGKKIRATNGKTVDIGDM